MLAKRLYRFALDRINGRFVSGWCFSRLNKKKPVTVTVVGDDQVLGSTTNSYFRQDLKEMELHPTGVCGFDFSFPADFKPQQYDRICLFLDSQKKPAATIDCRDITFLQADPAMRIFFMHLPKTAGTSFNAFARTCYPQIHYATHLERRPEKEWEKIVKTHHYVSGHLPWYEIGKIEGLSGYHFYALIREPYAHLCSHLNYVRGVLSHAQHEIHYDFKHNDTIKDLARRLSKVDFQNHGDAERFVASLDGFENDFFDNMQTRYFLSYRPDKVTKMDFDEVPATLSRFRLVGLTEEYDQFRNCFCQDIGVVAQPQSLRSNKSVYYRLFDHKDRTVREVLKPLVAHDLKLYEMIRKRFSCSRDYVEPERQTNK